MPTEESSLDEPVQSVPEDADAGVREQLVPPQHDVVVDHAVLAAVRYVDVRALAVKRRAGPWPPPGTPCQNGCAVLEAGPSCSYP